MKAGDNRGRLAVVVQVAAFVVAGGLFIHQLYLHVKNYLSHPTTTTVTLRLLSSLLPPPVVICPEYPFHLEPLRDLGMNTDTLSLNNISNLQDMDPNEDVQRVWEDAAYQLGQLVHSFTFGRLEENYTMETLASPYWRRVNFPLGSCFALLLPRITIPTQELPSLTITLRRNPLNSSCPLPAYSCSPSLVAQRCNSSCPFERFIAENTLGSYYIMVGKLYSQKSQHQYDRRERDTDYFLARDVWHTTYLRTSFDPMNVIEIYSTLVERRPLMCDSIAGEVSASDFDACVDKYFLAKNNCLPVRPNMNITLKEACKVGVMHEAINKELPDKAECFGPLTGQCHQIQWMHEVKNGLNIKAYVSGNSQVRLNFTSPKIRVETEVDMYPLSQLASDIGGSLGLFLGMSVLTMWQCVGVQSRLLPERSWGSQFNWLHCKHLMYWMVIVSLTFFTVVHSFLSLQTYITQPVRVSVKRANTLEDLPLLNTSDHLSDQIAALLASRALDCRPGPHTTGEECMLKCLVWQALEQVSSVAPFVEVDDLPICPHQHNWTYSVTYVVPSLSYTTATDPHLVTQCKRKCGGAILRAPRGLKVNHRYYFMTVNDLLCSLGGIVSLYAGLFLTSTVKLVIQLMPNSTPSTHLLRNIIKIVLNSVIYVSGAIMAIFLLYRFIFDHPVSSGKGETGLTPSRQPMLTFCHWPPFQSNIEKNFSMPVDEAWAASAWQTKVSRAAITQGPGFLTRDENDYNLTSVITELNRCESLTVHVVYKSLMVSLFYWWNPNDSVVVGVHSSRDPPFVSHIDNVALLQALTLNVVTASYRRLSHLSADRDAPTYDTCLHRCIHDMHNDRLGCRLPFTFWRSDLPWCSQDTARLHSFWPEGDAPPDHPLTMRKDSSHCHAACRQYKTEMILVQTKREVWLESGVNVMQLPESFVDLREEDWYSFLKLVNDLGVVAGFTFGASVFSSLQNVLLSGLNRL